MTQWDNKEINNKILKIVPPFYYEGEFTFYKQGDFLLTWLQIVLQWNKKTLFTYFLPFLSFPI